LLACFDDKNREKSNRAQIIEMTARSAKILSTVISVSRFHLETPATLPFFHRVDLLPQLDVPVVPLPH